VILDVCARIRQPAVLATVVRVEGSAYRRPGARMLIASDGTTTGMVSGGCLETDLADRAQAVLRGGSPRTVVYDMRSPDDIVWGLGLGCDGEVRVLLELLDPESPPEWCRFAAAARTRRVHAAVATVFESSDPGCVGCRCWLDDCGTGGGTTGSDQLDVQLEAALRAALESGRSHNATWNWPEGRCSGLVEVVPPRVRLHLLGAGADAEPLVVQASALDWEVSVFDHRDSFAAAARFPGATRVSCVDYANLDVDALRIDGRTALLLLTHHFLHDRTLLERLLESPAAYIGVLGPRRRLQRLLEQLAGDGFRPSASAMARLHGPVGLDIGSETPEEIALSALSEIQAVLTGRDGSPLRGLDRPLHDWPR
jgi:xanthine/CO dehydrogenase XdhC/CoxF family maturation factor